MKTVQSMALAIPLAASGQEPTSPAGSGPEAAGRSSDYVVGLEQMTAIQAEKG